MITFGIDVDEVIRNCLPRLVEVYNKEFNETKTVDDVTDYDVEKIFPRIAEERGMTAREWFFQVHGYDVFMATDPIEGAKEAMEILHRYGKIIIITKQQGERNKKFVIDWLLVHEIPYDDICFVTDKSIIKCDYFIDDHIENFKGVNARYGILITAPYNKIFGRFNNEDLARKRIRKISNCTFVHRFDNIMEFAKWDHDEYCEV